MREKNIEIVNDLYELFGQHKYYVVVSVSQLTNDYGMADSNGRVGEDEVVEVRFKMLL